MNIFYFYLILLLLIFVLIYKGISYSFNFAPVKIKVISILALIILSLRYIALLIFLLTKTIKYLYLLKPLIFLNVLCIPVLALIAIYILARKDKFKLNYCIFGSIIILLLYVLAIVKLPANIEIYKNLGYRMYFLDNNLTQGIYLVINTFMFFIGLLLLGNNRSHKTGIWLVFISALVVIIEVLVNAIGISIFPMLIFGDILWIITSSYALYKLKK